MKKTRKALAMLIVLCMVVCFAPTRAHAAEPVEGETAFGNGFSFIYSGAYRSLLVRGSGEMPAFEPNKTPWEEFKSQIQAAIIGDGITSISDNAFAGCTGLRRLVLSKDVKKIAAGAFAGCTSLVSIQTTGDAAALKAMLEEAGIDVSRISITQISQAQFELLVNNVIATAGTGAVKDPSYRIVRYDFAKRPIYIEEMDSSGNKTVTEIEYLAQPEKGTDETVETRTVTVDPAEGAATFTGTDYNDVGRTQRRETGELDGQDRVALSTEYTYGNYGATSVKTLDSVTYAEDGSYTQVWTTRGDYQGENLVLFVGYGGQVENMGISPTITQEIYEVGVQDQVLSIKTTQTNNGKVTAVSNQDFSYDDDGNQTGREWSVKYVMGGDGLDSTLEISGSDAHTYENGNRTSTTSTYAWGEIVEVSSQTAYTYNDDNQLTKTVTTSEANPGWSATEEYEYNENGSLTKYSYTDSETTQTVEYTYDEQGLKTGKTDTVENTYTRSYWDEDEGDYVDQIETKKRETVTAYNKDERATSRTVTATVDGEFSYSTETSYTYGDGNVLTGSVSNYTNGNDGAATTTTSQYNEMGFVTAQTRTRENDDAIHTSSFIYDENGILLKAEAKTEYEESTSTSTYTYNEDGQLASSVYADVWEDGEVGGSRSETRTYEDGLLVSVTTDDNWGDTSSTSYTYDEEGRCLTAEIEHSDEDGVWFSKSEEYTYNADGSGQVERTIVNYNWNDEDQLWVAQPAEVTEQQLDTDGCPINVEQQLD